MEITCDSGFALDSSASNGQPRAYCSSYKGLGYTPCSQTFNASISNGLQPVVSRLSLSLSLALAADGSSSAYCSSSYKGVGYTPLLSNTHSSAIRLPWVAPPTRARVTTKPQVTLH